MANIQNSVKETVLEIDLDALSHNYHFLKSKLKPETKFLAVVKAFAYGSDSAQVALKLQEEGVDYFAVAYANEGVQLRDVGITKPILVLHTLSASFEIILNHCLEPALYSFKILKEFISFAELYQQKNYPVHLKFNSGLNRLGFDASDVEAVVQMCSATHAIQVKSAFSHLAASEDHTEKAFTLDQINRFQNIANSLIKGLGYRPLLHTLNTSGILNFPEAQLDMVRSGIGLYGYGNDPQFDHFLKPIATLKTIVSQIHELKKGDSLGYNRAYKVTKNMRTATLPLGHADGISRIYGHGAGWVLIHGVKAPIVGNVCMDMIMVDVTQIDCEEGDEVIVLGASSRADLLAASAKTISYELITGLSQRIKRVIS